MHLRRNIHAIVLAAGSGERFGKDIPKQFYAVGGRPLLFYSLETFLGHEDVDTVSVVLPEKFINFPLPRHPKLLPPVVGGAYRYLSTHNALRRLSGGPEDGILVHDSARPLVPGSLIGEVCRALDSADAVVPVFPIDDALIDRDSLFIVDRAHYAAVQTPQGFRRSILHEAFLLMGQMDMKNRHIPGCEFEIVRGLLPAASALAIPGHHRNFKITRDCDLERLGQFTGDGNSAASPPRDCREP
jgi:2-C-methyl-D-erythritol 4-phosphate cytidylyltransferase